MTIISANSSGVVSGKFTIPANVPVGTKLVEFDGSGGSSGEAQYIGTNTLVTRNLQQIIRRGNGRPRLYDPLAQTFQLAADGQISGLDLWFTAKGTHEVIVHLRETQVGFPTSLVLAETRVPASSILTNGNPTRVLFDTLPSLTANVEYALVIMCDDAVTALSVAQLGKWDTSAGKWITSQPYQVGVLLSSSNNSTWTSHQDMDLTFRLLSPSFTQTSRTLNLGTTEVTDASDLMVMANVDIPTSSANCVFRLTLLDNASEQIMVSAFQPVTLASRYTGDVKLEAILSGTSSVSPVLYPDVQLAVGNIQETATYVTREFDANSGTSLTVTFDAVTPGSSAVLVEVNDGTGWDEVEFDSGTPVEDSWVERTHILTGFAGITARLRLTMTGNAAARPSARNLRAILT